MELMDIIDNNFTSEDFKIEPGDYQFRIMKMIDFSINLNTISYGSYNIEEAIP